eukprot:jgi/Ulvmu1/4534/UM002_0260.1
MGFDPDDAAQGMPAPTPIDIVGDVHDGVVDDVGIEAAVVAEDAHAGPLDVIGSAAAQQAEITDNAGHGRMCVLPVKSEALPGPASGWQDAVAGTSGPDVLADDDMDDDMDADERLQVGQVEVLDDMGEDDNACEPTPADGGSTLRFFFMDALYEPAMVGTVVMVGKVKQQSEYVSACVCVKGMKQCLFVVPKPFVFQDPDGDIMRCAMPAAQLLMTARDHAMNNGKRNNVANPGLCEIMRTRH